MSGLLRKLGIGLVGIGAALVPSKMASADQWCEFLRGQCENRAIVECNDDNASYTFWCDDSSENGNEWTYGCEPLCDPVEDPCNQALDECYASDDCRGESDVEFWCDPSDGSSVCTVTCWGS
jgi:hypothetical protein